MSEYFIKMMLITNAFGDDDYYTTFRRSHFLAHMEI